MVMAWPVWAMHIGIVCECMEFWRFWREGTRGSPWISVWERSIYIDIQISVIINEFVVHAVFWFAPLFFWGPVVFDILVGVSAFKSSISDAAGQGLLWVLRKLIWPCWKLVGEWSPTHMQLTYVNNYVCVIIMCINLYVVYIYIYLSYIYIYVYRHGLLCGQPYGPISHLFLCTACTYLKQAQTMTCIDIYYLYLCRPLNVCLFGTTLGIGCRTLAAPSTCVVWIPLLDPSLWMSAFNATSGPVPCNFQSKVRWTKLGRCEGRDIPWVIGIG